MRLQRLGARWGLVGGLVRSLSIKGGLEVCSKDLLGRTESASLRELAGGGDQKCSVSRLLTSKQLLLIKRWVNIQGGDDVGGPFDRCWSFSMWYNDGQMAKEKEENS